MYYVYVIHKNENNKLYYGYTNNLKRRMAQHNRNGIWGLVYYEAYKSESDARRRERRIKDYGQALTALKSRIKDSLS